MGFGTSRRQFLLKVGTLCQQTGVARFKHGAPGKDWYYAFLKRHPELSLRKPEKLGNVRARMLKPLVVERYFDGLGEVIIIFGLNYNPERIGMLMNAESSLNTPQSKCSHSGVFDV